MAKYNDDTYIATVVEKNKFDSISGATLSDNDLNEALKIARDCFSGNTVELTPMEELFPNMTSNEVLEKPSGTHARILNINKVVSDSNNYYVFEISFKDSFDMTRVTLLYALNEDGSFYKLKVIDGDAYVKKYDFATDLDTLTGATYTGEDLVAKFEGEVSDAYQLVKEGN